MKLRVSKQSAVPHGISFESRRLLNAAKKRAKENRRTLSGHICDLLHRDLQKPAAESVANPARQ